MKPDEFELVERLDREALARHPVWKTYRPGDRAWLEGQGVDPERLDAELSRFGYCGLEPLFPVPCCDPLPAGRREMVVAVKLRLASGHALDGWLMEPLAFGVFAEREYVFNRGLPEYARTIAGRLAAELGIAVDAIFPIAWRAPVHDADGRPLAGEIPAPW